MQCSSSKTICRQSLGQEGRPGRRPHPSRVLQRLKRARATQLQPLACSALEP